MYTFLFSPMLSYMVAYFVLLRLIIPAIFGGECKVLVGITERKKQPGRPRRR
jgi:hypothetical protein